MLQKGEKMKCSFADCCDEAVIKGMCRNHYQQWRYRNDKKYSEKKKKSSKEYSERYRAKKLVENPHFDRDKSREYRKKNKDKHTYSLAKHYWKKLTPEQRKKLTVELEIRG